MTEVHPLLPSGLYCLGLNLIHDSVMNLCGEYIQMLGNWMSGYSIPECVAVFAFVINLLVGGSFELLSYQLSTSKTAWGLFFCSCLLILEDISSLDQASGIP